MVCNLLALQLSLQRWVLWWFWFFVDVDGTTNNDMEFFYGQTFCKPSIYLWININMRFQHSPTFIAVEDIFKHFPFPPKQQTDLSTLFTFPFFCPPMDPMMMSSCLFAILTHSDISKRRLARQLRTLHQHGDTTSVSDDFACGTFHPWSMFLLIAGGEE